MGLTSYIGIGFLIALVVAGICILLRGDSLKAEKNKRFYAIVVILQAVHITVYVTGLLDVITQENVYIAFGFCAVISTICIVMSGWMFLPSSGAKHGLKYLLLLIAILQVMSTIIIFLTPEAGTSPLIPLNLLSNYGSF